MKSRLENDTKLILNFGYRETQNNLKTWNRNELKRRTCCVFDHWETIPMNYVTMVNICYLDITQIFMNTLHSFFYVLMKLIRTDALF